jgi:hypothetical protein
LLRAIRKIPKEKSFDPLLGLVTTATLYKPGSQARFLVGKMAESEKNIQEVLTKLAAHLEAIERKVDLTTADLGKVREKVDLAMSSISVMQEEQVQVHKRLQTMSATTGASLGDGLMGPAPSSTSTAASSAPPPIPSDQLLHNPQVTH